MSYYDPNGGDEEKLVIAIIGLVVIALYFLVSTAYKDTNRSFSSSDNFVSSSYDK
jgi:hypothetical protein